MLTNVYCLVGRSINGSDQPWRYTQLAPHAKASRTNTIRLVQSDDSQARMSASGWNPSQHHFMGASAKPSRPPIYLADVEPLSRAFHENDGEQLAREAIHMTENKW